MNRRALCLMMLLSLLTVSIRSSAADEGAPPALPAFPGAEGFGADTPGGRGGAVYEVTNLNDDGPGSLRDAVSEANRIVVFRVAGTIRLESPLEIRQPNITIAGQTAPGEGICLRDYPLGVNAHDVVVRYLRSRLGDTYEHNNDGMTVGWPARNVVVDHCSVTWSVDEALTLNRAANTTVQWCLIAEPLNRSKHTKGEHGYGSLVRAIGPVSLHHNLWADCDSRNPRLGDNYGRPPYPQFDVRNNVIYNYGRTCTGLTQGNFDANYVANYIRPGPSSRASSPIHLGPKSKMRFYIRDNVLEGSDELSADNSRFFGPADIAGSQQLELVSEVFAAPAIHATTADGALEAVLASVGASLPARDSVDARIVQDVRDRKGAIIDSQEQVGGWPELKSGDPPADGDHDGMPDQWETRHALNPNDAADGPMDLDKDGYTNVEEFLNGTDPRQFVDYRDPANNASSLNGPAAGP